MPVSLLIGSGSGLVSALLFYSATHGSPLLSSFMLLLTPLPSLIVGLGWGWLAAMAAALAGAVIIVGVASFSSAIGYSLALGAPVVMVAYLLYLSRPRPNDPDQREWYPIGRLIAAVSLYAGALPLLVLPVIGGSYGILQAPMTDFFRDFSARTAPELGLKPLTDQQIEALSEFVVTVLPGAFAAYWLAAFAVNLYLAGRIAHVSNWIGRDWPDLPALVYPPGFVLLLPLALLASFSSGVVRLVGISFAGALLVAYVIAGLTLMHFIARHRRMPWMLWFVYAGLLLFEPYGALALVIAGLLDAVLGLKRRLTPAPPSPTT
jgi:hypothetical protein